jgi:capsular polysaccharide biosynthesis protein
MKTPTDILRRLVRRFGLLVALTLLGAAAGATYSALKTPTYVAQAYVVVTAQPGESPVAVNFAQAFGRIVSTGPIADRAAAKLGGSSELQNVTVSTSPDAPVIEVTATGTEGKRTAVVANAVAQALVEFGATQKDQTKVTLSVLALASVPTAPSSPKPPLELAVGAAAGLLVGGLSVLAGVGKAKAEQERTADARREVTAMVPGRVSMQAIPPITATPQLEYGTRAIAFYEAAPQPDYMQVPSQQAAPQPEPDKIVGRAVVIYQDQR